MQRTCEKQFNLVLHNTMKQLAALLVLVGICLAGCSARTGHVSPKSWNSISEGMLRKQITQNIGQPVAQLSDYTEVWRSDGWELRVTYDQSGKATNVTRMLILK